MKRRDKVLFGKSKYADEESQDSRDRVSEISARKARLAREDAGGRLRICRPSWVLLHVDELR